MATAKFSLGTVNITQWLLIVARAENNSSVEFARQSFGPGPQPATRNITFTGFDTITYFFDIRESPDGTALGNLLHTFEYDVKNQFIAEEERFYLVGGVVSTDPPIDQDTLTDTYLNGKTITEVFQEGFRPLIPPSDARKEYDLVTGGGVKLLGGNLFRSNQVWRIVVSNLVNQTQTSTAAGGYSGVLDINNTTLVLNSTHRGKRLRCEGSGARQVLTLEAIAGVPEGTPIMFMSNGGNQYQTKIITPTGEYFKWFDSTYNEITIDQGEFLEVERRVISGTAYWEVVRAHEKIQMVGERFAAQFKDHPNTLPEDGALYDGDDFPRIWQFIKTKLPTNHYVQDDNVINGGYTRPAGKEGQFIVHTTQKKFRMPNTQNWFERGLKNFSAFGADTERTVTVPGDADYPGGSQKEAIKDHKHTALEMDDTSHGGASSAINGPNAQALVNYNGGTNGHATILNSKTGGVETPNNAGTETRGKNIGVIYLRRI